MNANCTLFSAMSPCRPMRPLECVSSAGSAGVRPKGSDTGNKCAYSAASDLIFSAPAAVAGATLCWIDLPPKRSLNGVVSISSSSISRAEHAPLPLLMRGFHRLEFRHHLLGEQFEAGADVLVAVLAGLVEQDDLVDVALPRSGAASCGSCRASRSGRRSARARRPQGWRSSILVGSSRRPTCRPWAGRGRGCCRSSAARTGRTWRRRPICAPPRRSWRT